MTLGRGNVPVISGVWFPDEASYKCNDPTSTSGTDSEHGQQLPKGWWLHPAVSLDGRRRVRQRHRPGACQEEHLFAAREACAHGSYLLEEVRWQVHEADLWRPAITLTTTAKCKHGITAVPRSWCRGTALLHGSDWYRCGLCRSLPEDRGSCEDDVV